MIYYMVSVLIILNRIFRVLLCFFLMIRSDVILDQLFSKRLFFGEFI